MVKIKLVKNRFEGKELETFELGIQEAIILLENTPYRSWALEDFDKGTFFGSSLMADHLRRMTPPTN